MLEKTFEAGAVEPRIAAKWDAAGAFRAGAGKAEGADPFCIVIPPPNVTGNLHMGHALNNTLQDILVRLMRMRGRDVLWQPGTDHAGIATQMVVERQMMERQEPGRREIGREKFLEKVWTWKGESGGAIVNQLKRLGASCDWSRERFTMDEGLSRAVLKVFVQLYREGLIYKDKRLVNWDPKMLTAISDLEVIQTEVKGNLYYFRYPVEGAVFDVENPETYVVVATTRPETMLGDSGVAIHPENEKLGHFIGKKLRLPLVGRLIPVVGDDYADPEKGTGAVKITPAHDFNDFEVGKRHNLAKISVLDLEAHVLLEGNQDFLAGLETSAELDETIRTFHGMERFAARKKIVAKMEELGFLEKIEPHVHQVPHGDRGNVPIEPMLTDQWYVNAAELAKPALASVREGRTVFVPKNWERTYYEWMENIQPWCISRQLWWGHQIPAWYGPDGHFFVEESEAEAIAAAEKHYGCKAEIMPKGDYSSISSASQTIHPLLQQITDLKSGITPNIVWLYRDEDVLDTWFSSALWPFSTLGWPDNTPELKTYYQTDVLVTGFDIIFFWVARMMMMGLHFMKEEPFHTVYIHALVRDEKGAKMSKSKGNVINPLDLVDEYGADAVRFTLTAMAAQGRDIKLSTQRVQGYRNFCTKLWNAVRFARMNGCARVSGFDPATAKETLNRWIITETAKAAADVSAQVDAYRFDAAAGAAYRFVWNTFCDWYLELTKPVLTAEDSAARRETRATCAWVMDEILKVLHPFMPFITEELWDQTAGDEKRATVLALTRYPENLPVHADAAQEINWLIDLITEIRSVRSEMGVAPAQQLPLVLVGASERTSGWLKTHTPAIERLARVSGVSTDDLPPPQSAQILIGEAIAALPLAGVVDLDAERARLSREADKLTDEIGRLDRKLANEAYVARAPEEVVEADREKLDGYGERLEKVKAALDRLK